MPRHTEQGPWLHCRGMARLDPHSYADDSQPRAQFLDWRADVDFAARTLACTATLELSEPAREAGPFDLDTRDLRIAAVADQDKEPLEYEVAEAEPILGSRLRIMLRAGSQAVSIRYETSPDAKALQWLEPAQTAAGKQPFLYTQCYSLHARSVVPLQDTPRTRLTFDACLTIPKELTAVMAAEALDRTIDGDQAVHRFRMRQPIAPYLFAFAVGDLQSRDLGERCRVWAEPPVVDSAAWEFADTETMLATGERLFGPYDWQRYDMLVLPPSFPYGGMENPRLTFLSSTIVARDRSLVSVIAHELAHSWTGNLISNANAEHFWLNEGWTTYAERRIVEALWGREISELHWALGRRKLVEDMRRVEELGPELSRLRTDLSAVDPDDALSLVPYEKGALFLRALEEAAGRERFDEFIRAYIGAFRFGALTTEEFMAFADDRLGATGVDVEGWLQRSGLPSAAPEVRSTRLLAIEELGGELPPSEVASGWTAIEWQLYLDSLGPRALMSVMEELDARFSLTDSTNYDILQSWLSLAIRSDYAPALRRLEAVLCEVGRLRFLHVVYGALLEADTTRVLAQEIFGRCAHSYHPIVRSVIGDAIKRAEERAR